MEDFAKSVTHFIGCFVIWLLIFIAFGAVFSACVLLPQLLP
jgi:hypothetical protein